MIGLPDEWVMIGHAALAMGLGGLIGAERELADKPAGLRTHMLVAGTSAFLVDLTPVLIRGMEGQAGAGLLRSDPARVMQTIITGISFLGAGTILLRRRSEQIEGLTTAGTILMAAAVGIGVAARAYVASVGVTALALLVLRGTRPVASWIERHQSGRRPDGE